jgi:uncharacterized protein YbcI
MVPRNNVADLEGIVRSRRDVEREISQAIIRFEKEFMGRGPLDAKSYIIEDMVLVRLKNVLTPAEMKLAESEEPRRGRYLIKQVRQELIEQGRPLLDAVILDVLGTNVISLHTDISARTGERIVVFTLENPPEFPGA